MKLPVYKLSVNDEDAENGEYLGILEIANTKTPAIQMKGIAFSETTQLMFKDDLKYRIASPALTPSKIYRRDDQTGEEYYIEVTPETVEQIFVKFQRDRAGKDIFNLEHDESKRVPSYILETWLVEKPEEDKSFTTYGIKCKEKTWFVVQQFTDKDAYKQIVDSGQIGFSIHGDGALKLAKQQIKYTMKKRKFIAQFTSATEGENGEIIVTADALEQGAEVVVVDDTFTPVENFSGEVMIEDEKVVITDNVITEIVKEEAVEATEATEEVTEEVEMTEEVKEEVKEEVEMMEEPTADTYTREEVDAKFDELYAEIAKMKVDAPVEMEKEEEAPSVTMSATEMKLSKIEQLAKFKTK